MKFLAHMLNLHFSQLQVHSKNVMDFFYVCKCGMLCVNFYSFAVYNSAVMEFWPLSLEQRITLVLKPSSNE